MSEETLDPIFEADPALGEYISHHPSRRVMLLIRGGLVYSALVLLLNIIFWSVDDQTASMFLPFIYAVIASFALWYVLHLWNREVVLYEHGLSYRQGSNTAYVAYANIIEFRQRIEQVSLAGFFKRAVYDYTLITNLDETLRINNLYSETEKLTRALDAFISRDRLPIIQEQISGGQEAAFTAQLRLTREGILYEERELFWHEFKGYRVQNGILILQSRDNPEWAKIPVIEINNAILLITLFKERRKNTQANPESI
jgi:hypothetical protein